MLLLVYTILKFPNLWHVGCSSKGRTSRPLGRSVWFFWGSTVRKFTKSAFIMGAAMLSAAFAVPAFAAVTLVPGDQSLIPQVHADPNQPSTGTTVYGLTKPGDVSVSFQSASLLEITGGSGYAQIHDFSLVDGQPLDDLAIFLTSNPNGFTAIEFSVQYASQAVSKALPGLLTISYELLGGGTGSLAFNSAPNPNNADGAKAIAALTFANAGLADFRLNATNGDIFTKLSNLAFDQVKQTDLVVATAAVPEPGIWAMMIFGFGVAGYSLRSRRRSAIPSFS